MALTQISTQGIKDGTITGSDLATNIDLVDNQKIRLGTSNDLEIFHSGSHSFINDNGTGNLQIRTNGTKVTLQGGTNAMLNAIKDGAVELYHNNVKKFETASNGVTLNDGLLLDNATNAGRDVQWQPTNDRLAFLDNTKATFGNGADLQIFHDGSNSYIDDTGTGDTYIRGDNTLFIRGASNQDKAKFTTGGSVELYFDDSKKFETTSGGVQVTDNLNMSGGHIFVADNFKLNLGTSDDLQIYHDGSHSFIRDSGTGTLRIETSQMNVIKADGSETMATFVQDAEVALFFDNSKKFETYASGIKATGNILTTTGDISCASDSHKITVGAGDDLQIFHNGNDSVIFDQNNASDLFIQTNERQITLKVSTTETALVCKPNSAVELYHNNSKKFETTSVGASVTGNLGVGITTPTFESGGGLHVRGATGGQTRLHLTTSNSGDTATDGFDIVALGAESGSSGGILNFIQHEEKDVRFTFGGNEIMTKMIPNGAVELYHNNVKMLDTSSQGVNFRGEIRSASTDSNLANCTLKNESTGADQTDYLQCRTNNNTAKMVVAGNGDLRNTNNSYGQESDSKLKENIVDANSQWNDIKAIKVRNFNFKELTGFSTHTQIGVVAQELEITSPHLVYESIDRDPDTSEDLGTKTKNVRYSVMYMKAIKALQEAMSRIETLETEVAALKAG